MHSSLSVHIITQIVYFVNVYGKNICGNSQKVYYSQKSLDFYAHIVYNKGAQKVYLKGGEYEKKTKNKRRNQTSKGARGDPMRFGDAGLSAS